MVYFFIWKNDLGPTTLSGLSGASITYLIDDTIDAFVFNTLTALGVTYEPALFHTVNESIEAFEDGRADVLVVESREIYENYSSRVGYVDKALAPSGVEIDDGNNSTTSEVYRFFNSENGSHFYTSSSAERDQVLTNLPQYQYEGNTFGSNATADNGGVAVHRFFNSATGTHFYTSSEEERQSIENTLSHFQYEGISYYAHGSDTGSNDALYRFFNTENGTHFFTTSETERDNIINTLGHYNYEGVAYYVDFA